MSINFPIDTSSLLRKLKRERETQPPARSPVQDAARNAAQPQLTRKQGGPVNPKVVWRHREGVEVFVEQDGRNIIVGAEPEGPPNRLARMGFNGVDISDVK